MEEHSNHPYDPDFYETGSTCPPKNHGGAVALLLAAAILLGSVATAVGAWNLTAERKKPASEDKSETLAVRASDAATEAPTATYGQSSAEAYRSDTTLKLDSSPASVENVPQEGGLSLQEIYKKIIGSVVSITNVSTAGQSTGTGVIFSSDGYIVTNEHVVDGAQVIEVLMPDDTVLTAELVGSDAVSDLAVLHVAGENLTAAEFGDSDALRVGDSVAAVGDPLGTALRGTMTDGIVSAINRDITVSGRTVTLIQTNAALNSGNSGGPLLNCYGQVIGINTMKIGDNVTASGVEGLGFAIPSTTVKEIVDQLISQGYVSGRASLGITGERVSLFYQHYYGMPTGLYITAVASDSVADQAGIAAGDVLVSVGSTRITSQSALNTALYAYSAGDTVEASVYRGGRLYTLELTLEEATGSGE